MNPKIGKLIVFTILLAALLLSSFRPAVAQSPEPPVITENGETLSTSYQFEQVLAERRLATIDGGENAPNLANIWWSASGTTFVPAASTISYGSGGIGCVDTGAVYDVWQGQVNLPHGSTVNGMWFNYYDEIVDPIDTTIYLRRFGFAGNYDDILFVTGTTNGVGHHTTFTSTVANNVVDNFSYSYVLVWVGRPEQHLCGVNIAFVPPPFYLSALPMITR